ncbi:MAG: PP2C family protein-serine/threonine phosphatase [Phycisphaerae bacterium]
MPVATHQSVATQAAHVQIIVGSDAVPPALQAALREIDADATFATLRDASRRGCLPTADAVVVVADLSSAGDADELRRYLSLAAVRPRGTMVVSAVRDAAAGLNVPATLPVVFCTADGDGRLATQLRTLIDMRPALESLSGLVAQRGALEADARHIRQQLRHVGQLQREFLPEALPTIDGVEFAALYRPADLVSGDIYDVRRLDEEHVAIWIADAEGHGLLSAMLTVFIKRALLGRERRDTGYSILPPSEVLSRLNDELLESALPDCDYVAAVYALFNLRTRELQIARAGSPYPIFRRANGKSSLLRPAGSLLGVVAGATYETTTVTLAKGDAVLFCSDGLVRLVDPIAGAAAATGALLSGAAKVPVAADQAITESAWYESMRRDGVGAALDLAAYRHDSMRRLGCGVDDLTAIAIRASFAGAGKEVVK